LTLDGIEPPARALEGYGSIFPDVIEPVPKLIDCALTRTVLGQALAVFQAFSLAKLRISKLLSQN
jgi:hypothetical protein